MKLVWILLTAAAAAAAPVATALHRPAPAVSVLQVPRGGGALTDDAKKNLAKALLVQCAANGAIGLPAPEKLIQVYNAIAAVPGSASELFSNLMGSGCASLPIMMYLSVFTETDAGKTALWGAAPCAYQTWKLLLQDKFKSAGCYQGFGVAMLLSFVPMFWLFAGKGDTDLIIKYFAAVTGASGVASMVGGEDVTKALFGVSMNDDAPTMSALKWMGRLNVLCAVMFWSLASGWDALKTVGYLSLIYAAFCVDNAFIQKDREGAAPDQDDKIMPALILFNAILGAGILLE